MPRIITFLISLALFFSSLNTFARQRTPDYSRMSISAGINAIISNTLHGLPSQSNFGIIIQSMQTGRVLYQRNPNHLYTPASIQKLLTAVAALDYLKPGYVFHTQLLSEGKIVKHQLQGNLVLKFSGDPELTAKDIQELFKHLHEQGIRSITGRVLIDNFDYGNIPYPPGWIWDDLSYSFAAPLNTIIIDRNYFILKILPSHHKNKPPRIKTNLPNHVINLSNQLTTVKRLKRDCAITLYSNALNHYTLRGCFYHKWKTQSRKVAIRNMPQYAKILVRNALANYHIRYKNPIGFQKAPPDLLVLTQHDSPTLANIIKQMLKDSDNLTTNAIFKKLGETYYRSRGTWQNSMRALRNILTKSVGINFKTNLVNDGAGLSRYNLLTPKQLSKLLYFSYHKKIIHKPLLNALPIAGKDGTMEHRLRSEGRGERILAKTGSMTGVASLAGYVKSKKNGALSFVIMINGIVKPRRPYILMEDTICKFLVHAKSMPGGKNAHG